VLITPEDFDRLSERERFIAAVEQGLAESDADHGVDDGELNEILDENFGPLDPT
jgi:hypothetical protein